MATPPKKVLVVEDDPLTQKIICDLLTSAGYQVVTARDASSAVKIVREEKPDLITLDILLAAETPEDMLDGFWVANWLKRLDLGRTVPIIIVSGVDPKQIAQGAPALRTCTFLPKPVEKARLLAAVAEALK